MYGNPVVCAAFAVASQRQFFCTICAFVLQLIFSLNFGSALRVILIISAFNSCLIRHRYCKDFPLTELLSPALIWVLPLLEHAIPLISPSYKNTPLGSSVFLKRKKIKVKISKSAPSASLPLLCHFCGVGLSCACVSTACLGSAVHIMLH